MENGNALPTSDALKVYRTTLQRMREQFRITSDHFHTLAKDESDPFKRLTLKMLSKYSTILEDAYTNIETLSVAQSAIKDQLDILKDIVVELPDVKENTDIQRKIRKYFNEYAGSH
jgi:hypothetical protein